MRKLAVLFACALLVGCAAEGSDPDPTPSRSASQSSTLRALSDKCPANSDVEDAVGKRLTDSTDNFESSGITSRPSSDDGVEPTKARGEGCKYEFGDDYSLSVVRIQPEGHIDADLYDVLFSEAKEYFPAGSDEFAELTVDGHAAFRRTGISGDQQIVVDVSPDPLAVTSDQFGFDISEAESVEQCRKVAELALD